MQPPTGSTSHHLHLRPPSSAPAGRGSWHADAAGNSLASSLPRLRQLRRPSSITVPFGTHCPIRTRISLVPSIHCQSPIFSPRAQNSTILDRVPPRQRPATPEVRSTTRDARRLHTPLSPIREERYPSPTLYTLRPLVVQNAWVCGGGIPCCHRCCSIPSRSFVWSKSRRGWGIVSYLHVCPRV